jgi:hypothetical protein
MKAAALLALVSFAACTWRGPLLTTMDAAEHDSAAEPPAEVSGDTAIGCLGRPKIDAGPGLNEGLLVWYRCEAINGTSLPDSSGRGNDGTLASGSGASSGPVIAAGKISKGLELSYANSGYVQMPAGLLAGACEFTIATWVYINDNTNAWTRIWDLGNDTNSYMFLTPITNTDNVARFGITVSGNQHEQGIKPKTEVPVKTWTHVAVTLGPAGGDLYFNGELVANNPTLTLRPADLGRMTSSFIGRSEFSDDHYLDATIDEFRVYDRALTAEEIKSLLTAP